MFFSTDDIERAEKSLEGKGATMEGVPQIVGKLAGRDGWLAHCCDTEGNLMAFMQERPT